MFAMWHRMWGGLKKAINKAVEYAGSAPDAQPPGLQTEGALSKQVALNGHGQSQTAVLSHNELPGMGRRCDVSTLHLLWGVVSDSDDTASMVLKRLGISPDQVKSAVEKAAATEQNGDG